MYLWKIENLKDDIRNKSVDEYQMFIYFMIFLVVSYLVIDMDYLWPSDELNVWDKVGSVGSSVLGVIATVVMFVLNGGKKGNGFILKYFSLGFVASIRYVVFTVPVLALPFIYVLVNITADSDISTTATETLVLFIWEVGLYVYICKHIYQVRNS